MRSLLLTTTLLVAMGCASAQLRDLTLNRAITQGGVQVTLQKIVVSGLRHRQSVQLVFRITDAAGRPLTMVQDVRVTLAGVTKDSLVTMGEADRLYVTVAGLSDAAVRRISALTLSLRAGNLPPTKVWANVPIRAAPDRPPAVPVYQDRSVQARVTAAYRSTTSALLGARTVPLVTVVVQERARQGRLPEPGRIRLEAPGAPSARGQAVLRGSMATHEATLVIPSDGRAPNHVTIRYFSGPAISRALKSHRFRFDGIRL